MIGILSEIAEEDDIEEEHDVVVCWKNDEPIVKRYYQNKNDKPYINYALIDKL